MRVTDKDCMDNNDAGRALVKYSSGFIQSVSLGEFVGQVRGRGLLLSCK